MPDLTEEQAAIYDRQIRVWGADVQQRLTGASVLVLGCTPLAAEVSKNFVLAGIGSVRLMDTTPAKDAAASFLVKADEGAETSAADAFAAALQEMNPMVSVSSLPGDSSDIQDATALQAYHLVLCFGKHAGEQARVNALCRAQGVKFMSAVSRGPLAYTFLDLLMHTFKAKAGTESAELPATTFSYAPLSDAAQMSWSAMPQRLYHFFMTSFQLIAQFEVEHGRFAGPDDLDALDALGQARLKASGGKPKLYDRSALALYLTGGAEFAPVNAIVGGFMANDVIRCISYVGQPSKNVLMFSVSDSVAQIHDYHL